VVAVVALAVAILAFQGGGRKATAPPLEVPTVVLTSQQDANARLTAVGFKVQTVLVFTVSVPPGVVVDQLPRAGSRAARGQAVTLTVSAIPPHP
jgi:beta-lactam-binding protein with PASTA domain